MLWSRYSMGTIQMDAEGWFSVTPEGVAACNARLVAAGVPGGLLTNRLAIDAFVGCGGDAIQLALSGAHVVAVDIDANKVAMARHNSRVYGVESRIHFVHGDFLTLAPRLRAHVCFLSPPWGGPAYSLKDAFRLKALRLPRADDVGGGGGDLDGLGLFELASRCSPSVSLFLPASVDDDSLSDLAARHQSGRCERVQLLWGGGTKRPPRPRATLAVYHAEPPEWLRGAASGRVCTRTVLVDLHSTAGSERRISDTPRRRQRRLPCR